MHVGRNPSYIPPAFRACIVILHLDKWYLCDLPCKPEYVELNQI